MLSVSANATSKKRPFGYSELWRSIVLGKWHMHCISPFCDVNKVVQSWLYPFPSNLPYSAFELLKLKLHFTVKNSLWRTTWCHRSYCYLSNINSQNWVCPQSAHPIPLFQGVRIFSRIYAPVNSNHFLIPAAMAEICSTFRYFIISALSSCLDFHEKRSLSQLRIKVVVPPFKFPSKENVAVKKNYLCRSII